MPENKMLSPILYVDDEKDNLTVFRAAFRRDYKIYLASSGAEGLKIMEEHEVHLVIADQRMPGMTGTEFLEQVKNSYPDCIRMVLTGFTDVEAIIQAINKGRVYRYITKPWDKNELKMNIDRAIESFSLKAQNSQLLIDLQNTNLNLEKKVQKRTQKLEKQKVALMDSIHYASRIQSAMLPEEAELACYLQSYFLLNKPKDIVSGDYYWVARKNNKVIVAVADCTGHGIPGAFMSILGISILNEIVHAAEQVNAGDILSQLRTKVIRSLRQKGKIDEAKDGMEISLCVLDFNERKLQHAGAFRPLYLIRDGEMLVLRGDSMPIGKYDLDECPFNSEELVFEENDIIYLFSDGYVDQLGGPHRKTFRSRKFKNLLIDIHKLPLQEQKEILEKQHESWKRDHEQIDDITVMGIRFSHVNALGI